MIWEPRLPGLTTTFQHSSIMDDLKKNSAIGSIIESTCVDIVWCTTTSSGTFGRQKQRSVKSKFNSSKDSPHKTVSPLLFATSELMPSSKNSPGETSK